MHGQDPLPDGQADRHDTSHQRSPQQGVECIRLGEDLPQGAGVAQIRAPLQVETEQHHHDDGQDGQRSVVPAQWRSLDRLHLV